MKIVILNAGDEHSLGWSYYRAFEALGHDTTLIDPGKLLRRDPLWANRLTNRLFERRLIERFNRDWLPDLIDIEADMVWVGKGAWATPWLWHSYKQIRPKTKLVCYNADDPITTFSRGGNRPWVTESIPCFDLFVSYKSALKNSLKQHGAKDVAIIPFAWDPAIHPQHKPDSFDYDLIFIGNGDAFREQWLTNILEQPFAAHANIAVFGHWQKVSSPALKRVLSTQQIVAADMARTIARSKLSINILRRQNEGSHNMRTFETPGCGGLNISQYSDEQNAIFPENVASVYFRSAEEAGAVAEAALANEESREDMRRRAGEIVQNHTYIQRAEELLRHAFA